MYVKIGLESALAPRRTEDYDNTVYRRRGGSSGPKRGKDGVAQQALGEFEQIVLLAVLHLSGDVYGVPIMDEIERRTGRTVARPAVYVTLRRLEKRGLISSWMSDATPERGGKARRCAKVETAGLEALRESRRVLGEMWKGLDTALEGAE